MDHPLFEAFMEYADRERERERAEWRDALASIRGEEDAETPKHPAPQTR